MRPRSRIQTTGPNNGHQLRDYSKSSNRSENRPLIYDGFQEEKRVDRVGASHGGVPTPHVHEHGKVRPAREDEI